MTSNMKRETHYEDIYENLEDQPLTAELSADHALAAQWRMETCL